MNHKKNIIIIGAGEIGTNVAATLVKQGHDVTVIEKDQEKIELLLNMIDVKTVLGNGCLPKNLALAGAENADILIALSSSDEVNMVASQVAYSLFNVKIRMARLYNQEYLDSDYKNLFNDEDLPIDYIISPEQMVADRIVQSLDIHQSYDLLKFVGDDVSVIGMKISDKFEHIGCKIAELEKMLGFDSKIIYISRGYRNYIPGEDETVLKSDIVYFIIKTQNIDLLIEALGEKIKKAKDILIIGGGNTGFLAAKQLEKTHNVKIIEKDVITTNKIAEYLGKTQVIHADAMNFRSLDSANVSEMDVVLNLTDSDEVNSLCSMYEKQKGNESIYTLIKNSMLGSLTNNMRFSRLITPRDITMSQINKFISTIGIYNLYTIQNNSAEIVELKVSEGFILNGILIKEFNDLQIGKIGAVVKKTGVTFNPSASISEEDRIIAVVPKEHINDFYAKFEV